MLGEVKLITRCASSRMGRLGQESPGRWKEDRCVTLHPSSCAFVGVGEVQDKLV